MKEVHLKGKSLVSHICMYLASICYFNSLKYDINVSYIDLEKALNMF